MCCFAAPKPNAQAVSVQSGKTYEQEFDLETKRMQVSHLCQSSVYAASPLCMPG
jgi:hypothetical protein